MSHRTTIIYYTDNKLEAPIAERCRELLVRSSEGKPIISVSQKPMDLGTNICVGEIGSSWLNLYKQLLAGAEAAGTQYIATAEHDCIYAPEHFDFVPPKDDVFYYNENVWLAQWHGNHPNLEGMYSRYWAERKALSQLVCNRELLIRTINTRLDILDKDRGFIKRIAFIGEPGATQLRLRKIQDRAASGSKAHLQTMMEMFKDYIESEKSDTFRTNIPNLDIRHKSNFTGPKRGKKRCWELPYWGKLKDLMETSNGK